MSKKRPPLLTQELAVLFGLEIAENPVPLDEKNSTGKGQSSISRTDLSDEEIWERILKSVSPLRRKAKLHFLKQDIPALPQESAHEKNPIRKDIIESRKYIPSPVLSIQPFSIDKGIIQEIGKGKKKIRRKIDLHGMQQDVAHRVLKLFFQSAQWEGERVVLVITGKGKNSTFSTVGILRRLVPLWLEGQEFSSYVAGYKEAHIHHGGGGALYVQLKKRPSAAN